jgi:uncharacterized lipoprotein YddW (UPF0748 family)
MGDGEPGRAAPGVGLPGGFRDRRLRDRQYKVSGIQLDRIRFPSGAEAGEETRVVRGQRRTVHSTADYNPEAIRRFKAKGGRLVAGLPAEADPAWIQFRQDLVTDFVRAARRELQVINPSLVLSAAVFPDPDSAARQQFQDWARWVREGHLDAVCTMNYETSPAAWEALAAREAEAIKGRAPLYVGIGADRFGRSDQLVGHIAIARRTAVNGYVIFNAYALFDKPGFTAALMVLNR